MKIFLLLLTAFLSQYLHAEEVKMEHAGITLNGNLEKSDNWPAGHTILMTHGTLFHNKSELMSALQALFLENDISSLAINLGLGINDRHGSYDCAVPHTHKHEDAIDEIDAWMNWLTSQGVDKVSILGHSRGGNQTAWYAAEKDSDKLDKVILIAPATWSPEYAAKDYKERYGKDLATVFNKAETLVSQGKGDTQIKPVDFIYCKETSASADSVVSYYKADMRKNTPSLLANIQKPVIVFAGSSDQVVKNLDKKLAPLAESGAIELVVLDGADHMFRDLHAEDLVDRAVEFVNE